MKKSKVHWPSINSRGCCHLYPSALKVHLHRNSMEIKSTSERQRYKVVPRHWHTCAWWSKNNIRNNSKTWAGMPARGKKKKKRWAAIELAFGPATGKRKNRQAPTRPMKRPEIDTGRSESSPVEKKKSRWTWRTVKEEPWVHHVSRSNAFPQ